MTKIRESEKLTVHQAQELSHMGFVLKLVRAGFTVDTYDVYVVGR